MTAEWERCKHQASVGCAIYDDRPPICCGYQCAWLRGWGEEEDRPDKIGLVVTERLMRLDNWNIMPNLLLSEVWQTERGQEIIATLSTAPGAFAVLRRPGRARQVILDPDIIAKASAPPIPSESPRSCGACGACCDWLTVIELDKPAYQKCEHYVLSEEGCCAIHDQERVPVCCGFQCMWLRGWGEEDDRPDKLGVLVFPKEARIHAIVNWWTPRGAMLLVDLARQGDVLVKDRATALKIGPIAG